MKKARLKLGDIFEIPLSGNRKTYGQYIFMDKRYGPLVRIFNYIVKLSDVPKIEKIIQAPLLFPPIIMGIHATIREGIWKVVGNIKMTDFTYPGFLHPNWDPTTGHASRWSLWNGETTIDLGEKVPGHYKEKECIAVYSYDLVVKRIETGHVTFKHLIDTNYYHPDQIPK